MDEVSISYGGDFQATITIERPDTLNSLAASTLTALARAAAEVSARGDSLKVVLLRGRGRAFSSGLDLRMLEPDCGVPVREIVRGGQTVMEAFDAIPAVTVAVLRGAVVGGGVVLASACDLRIAAEDTYFSLPEVELGVPVRWGGVPRLVRELGPSLARELMLTCRSFTAEEAKAAGFLTRVVPPAELDDAVRELADTLCEKPAHALLAVKRSIAEAVELMTPARDGF
ncbi:MAG: enoyl-CoA hydratase/isomerase family protein [bacterium]|nr:enoyl-CoA hydratase/isomerase family protein [bacterium]MDE0375947.1 enoyl-CoA hydratase/isomerase family protein [bacterium]